MRLMFVGLFGMAAVAAMAQQPAQPPAAPMQMPMQQQMQQRMQQQRQMQQQQAPMQGMQGRQQMGQAGAGNPQRANGAPMRRLLNGPSGRWWSNPNMAERLNLTADQQKKLDDVFQQFRLQTIDANAAVQKEQALLEPLVSAGQPDEAKILAQMDKLNQARGQLEKLRVRMNLAMRRILTEEQWKQLNAPAPAAAPRSPNAPAAPNGPRGNPPAPANPPAR